MNIPGLIASAAFVGLTGVLAGAAHAVSPCGDFGECKVLIEINSSDGDIGFHFLADGDNLVRAALYNPRHRKIFSYATRRELRDQFLTELFAESAEPLCFDPSGGDPDDDDEDFVTLAEFIERWDEGTYRFFGIGDDWELSFGEAELTFNLPAAPQSIEIEEETDGQDTSLEISWEAGDDLGACSDGGMKLLPVAPADVPVATWEVVVEPDVDGPLGNNTYAVRIPNGPGIELEAEVPDDYLETLPPDTPLKIEIGAIGLDDNATFTEAEDSYCANEEDGCDDD